MSVDDGHSFFVVRKSTETELDWTGWQLMICDELSRKKISGNVWDLSMSSNF